MKLKSKSILLLLLLTSAAILKAADADTLATQIHQLQQQLNLLKDYKANQADAFQNKAAELDLQVEAIRAERETQFWQLLGGATGIVIVVIGGYRAVYLSVKAKADKMISAKLQTLVKDKADELAMLLNRHARLHFFQQKKRILVLCHTEKRAETLKGLIHGTLQFKKATAKVVSTFKHARKIDLLVFDHEEYDPETPEQSLPMALIEAYLKAPNAPSMLYFGPQNGNLKGYSKVLSYANSQFTLFSRMTEIFDYQDAIGKTSTSRNSLGSNQA
jgi:hypothetical protein